MLFVAEIVPTQQRGRVAKQPRTHRVALAGDRVRTRSRSTDISCDQGEINNRLSCPSSLVALIDSHRPPERNPLAFVNQASNFLLTVGRDPRVTFDSVKRKRLHKLSERIKVVDTLINKVTIDPVVLDQNSRNAIQQAHVRLRRDGQVMRRTCGRFSVAWIDDNNLGRVWVFQNSLPHDRVSRTRIGADKNQHVRLFKIIIRIRRSIKTEGLFVSNHCSRHALPRVPVAVLHAHAELRQRA